MATRGSGVPRAWPVTGSLVCPIRGRLSGFGLGGGVAVAGAYSPFPSPLSFLVRDRVQSSLPVEPRFTPYPSPSWNQLPARRPSAPRVAAPPPPLPHLLP